MIRKLASFLVALLACLTAGGCITDPVTGRSVVGAPISEPEEAQMGLAYRPQIVQEFDGPYPDAQVQDHLEKIVLGMARRSVRPDLPWTFTVLNSSVPNAFAVPGGQVFVTRGLLNQIEDEAEFAVVMGHELGHVEHRHSVQQQGWQMITGTLVGAVASAKGETWGQIAGYGSQIGLLKFSRADESEADERGVENSYSAGYDPRQGADLFRMFLRLKEEQGGDGTPTWLSSHPADEERIQDVLRLSTAKDPRLAGTGPVGGLRVTTPAWERISAKVRSDQRTYDRYDAAMARITAANGSKESVKAAVPEFRKCANELPGHALLHATLGKALLISGDGRAGREALERASSMDQELFEPEFLLGALALDAKNWKRAASYAERGLSVLPDNYLCLWVRGESNWNLGRREAAEADLRAVLEIAPKASDEYKSAAARLGVTAASADPAAPARKAGARKRVRK